MLATAAAFWERDLRIAWSYRIPFIPALIAGSVSLITFRFIAKLVGSAEAIQQTGDFFSFVVVGMVAAHILQRAMTAPPTAARLEQVQGTLEVLATRPLTPAELALGWSAFPLVEGITIALAMLGIGALLGVQLTAGGFLAAIPVLALSGVIFASMGVIVSAVVLVFQRGSSLTRWMVAGMGFLSGVLFPVSLLPRWAAVLAELSPMTHTLRALRASLLAGAPMSEVAGELALLGAIGAAIVPLAIAILALGLRRARATGAIATY